MDINNYTNEIPIGFGMALAQNQQAMEHFANLSQEHKQAIINGTHAIHSKQEMRDYVSKLVPNLPEIKQ